MEDGHCAVGKLPRAATVPADCTGIVKRTVEGRPDEKHISTSFVERQNLTMRMQMRRFTRLTNAFSKKFENHMHMVALYTVWYNFIRIHKTLRVTPAMEDASPPSMAWRRSKTGQIIGYINRTYRVLPTEIMY